MRVGGGVSVVSPGGVHVAAGDGVRHEVVGGVEARQGIVTVLRRRRMGGGEWDGGWGERLLKPSEFDCAEG